MSEKKERREELFYTQKNGHDRISAEERAAANAYCEGYKAYLNDSKTEREAVRTAIALAEKGGFKAYDFETGAEIPVENGAAKVTLKKHDFAIISFR